MSGPDRIDEAFAAWRAATDAAAPSAALLDRIARATREPATPSSSSSSSLALAVWRIGRPALAGLAVAAALLLFAATRSVDRLEDRAAAAIEVLAP